MVVSSTGACAEYGVRPACPARGGSPFIEVDSPHFHVVTELDSSNAESIVRQLEEGLAAIGQAAFEHVRTTVEPTTVVVFRDESHFHAFAPGLSDGVFYRAFPNDLEPSPVILLYGSLTERSRVACLHELTHAVFAENFGWSPPWLNEGWAEYYSTARVKDDRVYIGAALPGLTYGDERNLTSIRASDGTMVLAVPTDLVTPPSQLLGLDHEAFYRFTHSSTEDLEGQERAMELYVGAWAFVHLLQDGPAPYPERFRAFLREVVGGGKFDVAWGHAFAGMSAREMDRDFVRYLARREVSVFAMDYRLPAADHVTERAMSDAEVHLLWARLSPWSGAASGDAARDLDAAVAANPLSPEARYLRGRFRLRQDRIADAESDLSAAVRLSPDDPRYRLGVVELRVLASERAGGTTSSLPLADAVEELARVARSATELRTVARLLSEPQRKGRRLDFARRAVALAPIDSFALDTYAELLAEANRLDEALDVERRAISFLPDHASAAPLFQHLESYEKRTHAAAR